MKKMNMMSGTVVAVMVLFFSCTSPFSPTGSPGDFSDLLGVLRIDRLSSSLMESSLSGSSLSGSVVAPSDGAEGPAFSYALPISQFKIEVHDGPDDGNDGEAPGQDMTVAASDGNLGAAVEFRDLVVGDWTLTVTALDGNDNELLAGSVPVTITPASITTIDTVELELITEGGEGTWELNLQWSDDSIFDDYQVVSRIQSIEYSIAADGTSLPSDPTGTVGEDDENFTSDNGEYMATLTGTRVPGRYRILVEFVLDQAAPFDRITAHDAIWTIGRNVTTSFSQTIGSSDFPYGGGVGADGGSEGITIEIRTPEDLTKFFSETPDATVVDGETLTITAEVAGGTGHFWRVNGVGVTGENGDAVSEDGETLIFTTAGRFPGTTHLITLGVTVDGVLYTGSHRVRIISPEEAEPVE